MTAAMWSTRDELLYWLEFVGMGALLVVVAVVRFALTVAFRVLDLALWVAGAAAVLALAVWVMGA